MTLSHVLVAINLKLLFRIIFLFLALTKGKRHVQMVAVGALLPSTVTALWQTTVYLNYAIILHCEHSRVKFYQHSAGRQHLVTGLYCIPWSCKQHGL